MTPIKIIGLGLLVGSGIVGYFLYKGYKEGKYQGPFSGISSNPTFEAGLTPKQVRHMKTYALLMNKDIPNFDSNTETVLSNGFTPKRSAMWKAYINQYHPNSVNTVKGMQ